MTQASEFANRFTHYRHLQEDNIKMKTLGFWLPKLSLLVTVPLAIVLAMLSDIIGIEIFED